MGGARGRKRLNIQAITQPVEITSLSASEHQKFKPLARMEFRTGEVKESVVWSQHVGCLKVPNASVLRGGIIYHFCSNFTYELKTY